ncbi:hypothetical protein Ahy_B06g080615 [Arachis hypogaea]|uniref:Uncharacterized protein n=1 Tax=Arachis hypogaea TaxID=3818 RepID=A0A444YIG4_ARAHY|nr:hypothetical protein Ahy_B06g080615 [Arachis hypogaea]
MLDSDETEMEQQTMMMRSKRGRVENKTKGRSTERLTITAPATVSEAQDLCRKLKPDILFLIETRAKECRIMKLKRKLHFEKHFCVEPQGLSGGLCLLWNKNLDVDVYAWSDNYIKAKIKDDNNYEWSCYFVYGNPKFQHRKAQWKELSAHNRPTNDP